MSSIVYNQDCLEAMRQMPDNAFDLAVVDPPYGINGAFLNPTSRIRRYGQTVTTNENVMGAEYFTELFRVAKNQIVFGYNYLCNYLPPTKCFIFWDKRQTVNTYAAGELAYTSFDYTAKCAVIPFNGGGGSGRDKGERIHPHQKPIALYAWIFQNFAQKGQKILDTHLGSGSSRIAAYDAGLDFVGYEIDKTYFDKAEERFQKHVSQLDLFHLEPQPDAVQQELTFV